MAEQQRTINRPPATPDLDEREKKIAEDRAFAGANVIHEAIRKQGEEELRRTSSGLAWSGLAAGLSMGFSMVTQGLLSAHLPDVPWKPLVSKFGYSIGFLIITGSIEVMYGAITGGISWGRYFGGYMIPTLLGNILGGVSLVAVVNHAQVVAGGGKKKEE